MTTYTLPFGFSLYGTIYNTVTVSSQGYLQFSGPNYYGYDTPSVADLTADARIAPFWALFNTYGATGDGVFVSTTASSVTFEWVGTNPIAGGGQVNFAAVLNNNGSFSFDYGAGNANLSPIIGVSAGVHAITVLSTANGNENMSGAAAETFTPQPGDVYFDIGAFEFQGNSADKVPPKVVSVTPLPANNGTTGLAFTSLTVTFTEALDLVSASSPANYSLIKADSNGQFNTTGATVIPVTPIYSVGATTATLELPNGALAPGKYQLTLSGTRAIFDQSGNALAGNGTTAGTDYVTDFTINRSADIAPVATPQTVSVAEDSSGQIVLAATDTQGNPLTYTVAQGPANGSVSAITNGNTLTYTPSANFYGADSFTFQATDPDGESSQATVTLNVTPVNQAPVALPQSLNVTHDAPHVIILSGTDAETPASQLTYAIVQQPTHGTLTQNPGSSNAFTYTPAAGYLGTDSFTFTVTDTGNPPGTLGNAKTSAPATVSVDVVDPAPVGVPATYATREGLALNVPAPGVLASDTDAAGDTLTATLVSNVTHGTLVLNLNGSFTYTPNATFTGADLFTYLPHGAYVAGSATTVTINVSAGTPPPPPPPRHAAQAAAAPAQPVTEGVVTQTALVAVPALLTPLPTLVPQASIDIQAPVTRVVSTPAVVPTIDAARTVPVPVLVALAPTADLVSPPTSSIAASSVAPAVSAVTSSSGSNATNAVIADPPVSADSAAPPPAADAATTLPAAIATVTPAVAPVAVLSVSAVPLSPIAVATPPAALQAAATITIAAPPTLAPALPTLWLNTAALMAMPDPIVLPGFTVAGDEVSAFMLPASPDITSLPQAFTAAARRLTERQPALVTFIDPVTGQPIDDDPSQTGAVAAADPTWLLIDPDLDDAVAALTAPNPSGPIRWDSHPA